MEVIPVAHFKHLFEPLTVGNTTLHNRILSTAHQTNHVHDGIPTSGMLAYHLARARGGAGLIILEAAAVHISGMLTTHTIAGYDEKVIPAYATIARTLHEHGTAVFTQLFHGGREVVSSDYRHAALAPSAEPSLRFGVMPRPMSQSEIHDIIRGFAHSARIAQEAGLDGVEVCCSHGYLPAQFWSPHVNHRTDEYGGPFENRMRFIVEVLESIWSEVGEDFTVGIRMSSNEMTMDGATIKDAVEIVDYLVDRVRLDFINVTAGESSTYAGSTHIVPPSPIKHAYVAADGFKIRMAGAVPVFVGSRIVDPAEAEKIVSTGQADAVAMTRALIVDPQMPNKAHRGELQTIDACIGCLQACIGHYHRNLPIGCVQNPVAGQEEALQPLFERDRPKKRVVIVGAGPAGLQAAVTADALGHEVILLEEGNALGGLLRTMRCAPMRRELAESMLDNYTRKLAQSQVDVRLGQRATRESVRLLEPDAIVCAVGSSPYMPRVPGMGDSRVVQVGSVFGNAVEDMGERVVIMDYVGDWQAIEAAIHLAERRRKVTLVCSKLFVGEEVHQFLRNEYMKRLYELSVEIRMHYDFGGIVEDKLKIRHVFAQSVEDISEWDQVVLSMGRVPNTDLYEELQPVAENIYQIGDCLAPRTLEEATYEGMMTSLQL